MYIGVTHLSTQIWVSPLRYFIRPKISLNTPNHMWDLHIFNIKKIKILWYKIIDGWLKDPFKKNCVKCWIGGIECLLGTITKKLQIICICKTHYKKMDVYAIVVNDLSVKKMFQVLLWEIMTE